MVLLFVQFPILIRGSPFTAPHTVTCAFHCAKNVEEFQCDNAWVLGFGFRVLGFVCREEQAEVDVPAALFVLFGTAMVITTLLAIYILQESKDKIAK